MPPAPRERWPRNNCPGLGACRPLLLGLVVFSVLIATACPADADEAAPAASTPTTDAAASPGQADLDAAIDAKLSANQLDDFATVLDLCRRAIRKGLDEDGQKFAEDLYTGTLVDRAGMLVEAIFNAPKPDEQWPRMRTFAMRDLNEVIARDGKLGQAHLMISRLESLPGGDRERAAAAAGRALELIGDDRLQLARAHLVLGTIAEDAEKRMAEYDQAVELAPRDVEVRRTRGLALLVADEFARARDDLLVATKQDSDDPALFEALGMACMMGERLDEAEEAFGTAIELSPGSTGLLLQRARLLAVRGERERALADVDAALGIDPASANARVLRARVLQQSGDADAALADLETVLREMPDMPEALELRGLIAADRNDLPAAIRDFRRLAARNADDHVLISQLAMLYLAAKQPREAIRRFTRALELDEEHFSSRRGRSDAEISIGDHKAAIADLEKALELKPDDSGVLNNLAWLLATSPDAGLRDGRRSVELARKACEKTEWKEAHIISTLAAGYAETGDFESARRFSRQAVETGETSAEVKMQLQGELASYEQNKPWRERQEMADAPADETSRAGTHGIVGGEQTEPVPRKPRRPFDEE